MIHYEMNDVNTLKTISGKELVVLKELRDIFVQTMLERIGNFSFEVSDSRITGFTISSLDLSSIPQQVFSFSNFVSL